jgi:predicted Zn finger-like uncharacterized protein
MLIECTFCRAQAKIPDSKEGAKVKCGECGKVYVARDPSQKGRAKASPTPYVIGGAVVVGVLAVVLVVNSRDRKPAPKVAAAPKVEEPAIDRTGWDSELVKEVRDLYDAAFKGNVAMLQGRLHLPKIADRLRATPEQASLPQFAAMSPLERDDLAKGVVEQFLRGEGDAAIAKWKPFDGQVEAEGDEEATVRVDVRGREGDAMAENRTIEWQLAKDARDGKWKVWSWERWISPEERRNQVSARSKGITRATFADGGMLYQAEPKPIPHFEETPQAERQKIDELVVKLVDFKLKPRENDAAGRELAAIGKASIPALLTKMYEIKITDDDTRAKVAKVFFTFRDVTGYDPGFSVTGSDPDSDAKREAAIKACFAWFQRKGDRFEEKKVGVDLLEGMIEPTERDQREMEKIKKGGG